MSDKRRTPEKKNPHHWIHGIRDFPWTFCGKCGLVKLRNEASAKRAKASCKGEEE